MKTSRWGDIFFIKFEWKEEEL